MNIFIRSANQGIGSGFRCGLNQQSTPASDVSIMIIEELDGGTLLISFTAARFYHDSLGHKAVYYLFLPVLMESTFLSPVMESYANNNRVVFAAGPYRVYAGWLLQSDGVTCRLQEQMQIPFDQRRELGGDCGCSCC